MSKDAPDDSHKIHVNTNDLLVFQAMCCSITSCYTKYPECCGCIQNSVCCCCVCEGICCKTAVEQGEWCVIQQQTIKCIRPTTCCGGMAQIFCFDSRCAFPCDKDVPCMVTYCFLTCCYNWNCNCACCKKLKDIKGDTAVAVGN